MNLKFIFLLVIMVSVTGCLPKTEPGVSLDVSNQPVSEAPYESDQEIDSEEVTQGVLVDEAEFTIMLPENWKSSTPVAGVNYLYTEVSSSDAFAENINVVMQVQSPETIDSIEPIIETYLSQIFGSYTIERSDRVTVDGGEALLVEGVYPLGNYMIHNIQLFVEGEEFEYILTATSTTDDWDAYRDSFTSSLLSFQEK